MTDPFDALREPGTPADPDPEFAERLRTQLTREVFNSTGGTMPQQTAAARAEPELAPPTLTPYIVVSDARRALTWYVEVFGGQRRGADYVNPDGTIGHAEIRIGDAVLMLSEASDLWPDVPVGAPDSPATFSHSLHLQVDDVDAATERARRGGAAVEREPTDQPYGRAAVLVDPFGHRWILLRPPARPAAAAEPDGQRDDAGSRPRPGQGVLPGGAAGHVLLRSPWRLADRGAESAARHPAVRAGPSRRCSCPTGSLTSRPRSSGSGRPAVRRAARCAGNSGCSPTASTTRAGRSGSGSQPSRRSADRARDGRTADRPGASDQRGPGAPSSESPAGTCRAAWATSSRREVRPVLAIRLATCVSTVFGEMSSRRRSGYSPCPGRAAGRRPSPGR